MKSRAKPFTESAPVPIVREFEGQAGWDEWTRAVQQQDAGFAPTAPISLDDPARHADAFAPTEPVPLPTASPAAQPPAKVTLEHVLQEVRRNNRVCPVAAKWQSLYVVFAANAGTAPLPAAPPAGAAWDGTPAPSKRMGFVEHLEWAAAQGCLSAVHAFIKSLKEDDWHHAG